MIKLETTISSKAKPLIWVNVSYC